MNASLEIKKGGLKSLFQGHPWVYAQSVGRLQGRARAGEAIRLNDAEGRFLAWAWYSPESHIRARVVERREGVFPDEAWLGERLSESLARRRDLGLIGTQACRLVNAEADGLPGLIVDRYGPGLVVQALSAGAEAVKFAATAWLQEHLAPEWIWERSDQEVRKLEGLSPWAGPLFGQAPERLRLEEDGVFFFAQPLSGQKTGFFLDQRDNRRLVAGFAHQRRVLDCFCYSGGFSLRALKAGALSAALADSSASALELARENLEANDVAGSAELVKANVFDLLRAYREEKRRFDLIVLDPPKLAPTKASLPQATRAYKDVNMGALRLLPPGGILATFSCSAGMDMASFQAMLLKAAEDTGRRCQVLHALGQPPDHPYLLGFPESHYLKGLILRVL